MMRIISMLSWVEGRGFMVESDPLFSNQRDQRIGRVSRYATPAMESVNTRHRASSRKVCPQDVLDQGIDPGNYGSRENTSLHVAL
jgi:hypothetical protein